MACWILIKSVTLSQLLKRSHFLRCNLVAITTILALSGNTSAMVCNQAVIAFNSLQMGINTTSACLMAVVIL